MKLSRPVLLTKKILLVEGLTRSGKFLLANFLSTIKEIDHINYNPLVEQIPFLVKQNLLDKNTGKVLLQTQFDNNCYDLIVGRGLNFRREDKSSVYNSPHQEKYLQRCSEPENLEKVKENYFPFIAHECLQFMDFLLETFPEAKVIRIIRNPIDLVYSWFNRGWGKRWGEDPKLFSLVFEENIPWYAVSWKEEYLAANEMDRVIKSIYYLKKEEEKTFKKLTMEQKERIYSLTLTDLIVNPDKEVNEIARFLDKETLPVLEEVKSREKCPQVDPASFREEKLSKIKDLASERGFMLLTKMNTNFRKDL